MRETHAGSCRSCDHRAVLHALDKLRSRYQKGMQKGPASFRSEGLPLSAAARAVHPRGAKRRRRETMASVAARSTESAYRSASVDDSALDAAEDNPFWQWLPPQLPKTALTCLLERRRITNQCAEQQLRLRRGPGTPIERVIIHNSAPSNAPYPFIMANLPFVDSAFVPSEGQIIANKCVPLSTHPQYER